MKVLWIVNTVLGPLSQKMYGKQSSGAWMDALLSDFVGKDEYSVVVATTAKVPQRITVKDRNITYYALPDEPPILYDENKESNILAWRQLLEEEKPDLIQVWGTEFTHGLCALRQAGDIPSVIYMQGYLGSIARHYLAGLSHEEIRRTITVRDILKRDSIEQQRTKYFRSTEKEKEMLRLAGRMICENDWCESSISAVVPDIKTYRCPLSINSVFGSYTWDIGKVEKHSIICTASGYPLKGLHMMLRAVALLKTRYPDIKLYLPGTKMISDGSLQWTLRKRGYTKYIENLVRELDISEQIVWLGRISQEQLAEQYSKTHVFVLSSSIENHSSSLKEAMMVGVPCVASAVGGVPEYVSHGENGFLYRFEEYEIMAGYVSRIFENNELAGKLSNHGKSSMKPLHSGKTIFNRITEIYQKISDEDR